MQRNASVSVRQGPSRCPSLVDRRRNCSPEETCVIPRELYASYFVLKQNLKNWKSFYLYQIRGNL